MYRFDVKSKRVQKYEISESRSNNIVIKIHTNIARTVIKVYTINAKNMHLNFLETLYLQQ